ncbi:MAG: type II toxin-antitoxin system RelE/ParE family toxin [Planctomycetaceae bacterium]|nr:type II toxin-antitoxin system RelE/ParE family toxin [Planctomycetaceae bacterium]
MKPVRLSNGAAAEIDEAAAYFNDARPGFGDEFEAAVEAALDLIGKQPRAFSPYHSGYRKFVLGRYRHLIFYREYDAHVWVAAVHHASREPDTWMDRTPDDSTP